MGLKKEHIVKLLQLEKLGRTSAFKLCEIGLNENIQDDKDLMDFVSRCIGNKDVKRLPTYSESDFIKAFKKGDRILEDSFDNNIEIISFFDDQFPALLKEIKNPPILLNFKGDYKRINEKIGIAIIGTREPTLDGYKAGEFFGDIFGKHGFNVVSGLAKGCDTSAHKGCLKGKGFTTAILAHGLDKVYPPENKSLTNDIVQSGGVLLSEYFIGTNPFSNYFVERDRLQAGLSKATLVVQTGVTGGTMHAVNATIESKKLLLAVNYSNEKFSEKNQGNKMLIDSKGALPITSNNYKEIIAQLIGNPIKNQDNLKNNCDDKIMANVLSTVSVESNTDVSVITKADDINDKFKLLIDKNVSIKFKIKEEIEKLNKELVKIYGISEGQTTLFKNDNNKVNREGTVSIYNYLKEIELLTLDLIKTNKDFIGPIS